MKNRLRRILRTKYLAALQNFVPEDLAGYVRTKLFPMTEPEAHRILSGLLTAGAPFMLGGGWGVSAVTGGHQRRHSDLDLIVPAADFPELESALDGLGYHCTVREGTGGWWAPDVSVFRTAVGDRVEILRMSDDHFAKLTAEAESLLGRPVHERTAPGVLNELTVPCLSVELQLAAHHGYKNTRDQSGDLALLTAAITA